MSPPSFCESVSVSVLPTYGAEDLACNTSHLQHPLPTCTLTAVAETLRMFSLRWAAQIEESIILKFAASLLKYLYLKPNLNTFYGPFVVVVQMCWQRSLPEWLQSSRLHSRVLSHTQVGKLVLVCRVSEVSSSSLFTFSHHSFFPLDGALSAQHSLTFSAPPTGWNWTSLVLVFLRVALSLSSQRGFWTNQWHYTNTHTLTQHSW